MAKQKGPFQLVWRDYIIDDVEEVSTDYDVDTEDYTTVQQKTFEIEGSTKAGVSLTLLENDLPVLAALLPQHWVANGGVMSTGETVSNANGAMDFGSGGCDVAAVYDDLDIISCGNPGQVFRIVNARTRLEGVEFDDKIRKVTVRFIGEPGEGEGNVQFFKEGSLTTIS